MNATRNKKSLISLGIMLAVVAINLACSSTLRAQDAIAHAPSPDAATPQAGNDMAQSSSVTKAKGPFDWLDQRLPIHFSLVYGNYYDDNIFLVPKKTSDFIFNITPGVNYAYGEEGQSDNYLALRYAPTIIKYYTTSQQDSVNQDADMLYEHNFNKLKLSLEQGYDYTNQSSIQAGTIVVSSVYATKAAAHYDYSDKVSIMADFDQTLSYYKNPGYTNIYEWAGGAYFLYQVTPKLSLGVGPRIGTENLTNNQPDQTWYQGLVHLTYTVTEKISITASGGGEVRQYDANIPNTVTGVFNLGGYWTPFDGTSVNLVGYRRNNPSYSINGANYTATGISSGIRQRFLQDFYLGVNGGYENDAYTAANVGVTGARNDNYYYIHPYFQWDAQKWLQFIAYYQYSDDDSNLNTVSFNDNQVGCTLSFKY